MLNPLQPLERGLYDSLWFAEHVLGALPGDPLQSRALLKGPRALLKSATAERLTRDADPARVMDIERVKDITPAEFRSSYLAQGRPVIIEGFAKAWPAVGKWTPQFIADLYGDDKVTLIDAAPNDFNQIDYRTRETTLRDVILTMDEQPLEKYSRFNRLLHEHPELKDDFDTPWLLSMRNMFGNGETFQTFIGGKGSKTHLHCAAEHNIFVQVYGRKHWTVYHPTIDALLEPPVNRTPYFHSAYDPEHPDFVKYPGMAYVDRLEFVLEPGDVFFMPPSWWHHVRNLTGSIGVAFRWFAPDDCFRIHPMQTLLTLLAVNPPIWKAMELRTDFPKIFEHMARSQVGKTGV